MAICLPGASANLNSTRQVLLRHRQNAATHLHIAAVWHVLDGRLQGVSLMLASTLRLRLTSVTPDLDKPHCTLSVI